MESVQRSSAGFIPAHEHVVKWSPSENSIARKIFDGALKRELDEITQKVKEMAALINNPSELWNLEDYLTKSRKTIDDKYDYRYSVLPLLFARLVSEGRITREELHGLAEDKLGYVRFLDSDAVRKRSMRWGGVFYFLFDGR
jgi:hypothetical protein